MTTYAKLSPDFQDQAQMVREFQQRIKKLKDLSGQIGTPKDSSQLWSNIAKEKETSIQLCRDIINSFKTKAPRRDEKLQHEKLTKEFESLSKQFSSICQGLVEKQKIIIQQEEKDIEVNENEQHLTSSFQSVGGLDEALLTDRLEELGQLEKDMNIVNSMFKDVAAMVGDQGEMLDGAEQNVETAEKETRRAVGELDKAEDYQKKSKRKLLCILGIVAVVIIILIAIIVGTVVF